MNSLQHLSMLSIALASITFAAGANVFSMIRALSSCHQRRRQSNPSNSSTRPPDELNARSKVSSFTVYVANRLAFSGRY